MSRMIMEGSGLSLDASPLSRAMFAATYDLLAFEGDLDAQRARMEIWARSDEVSALAALLLSGRQRQAASTGASIAVHAGQINLYSGEAFSLTLQRFPAASVSRWLVVDACDQIVANVSGLDLRVMRYRSVGEGATLALISDHDFGVGCAVAQLGGSGALHIDGGQGGWALRFGSAPKLPYQQFYDTSTLARTHIASSRSRDTAQVNALLLAGQLRAKGAAVGVEVIARNAASPHVQWMALRTLVAIDPARGIECLEHEAAHGSAEISRLAQRSLPGLRAAMSAVEVA
ncbi:hypothetical protein LU699_15540 [Luteimonas fraxinea]|uniref:hypothetical protein n=1 Tax=Luteimonas fraxinea TaxID=2901869 RepID=UPI001E3D1BCD|nr:hypothetical protein [Luteimonas fraxinea]UHH09656.1 hypothetical protein LU699_15540 [Luteimonas fraxinea]